MRTGRRSAKRTWIVAAGALFALLPVILPPAWAKGPAGKDKNRVTGEVEEILRSAGPDDLLPVIVQTAAEPTTAHLTRLHGRGGSVKARHTSFHGYSARIPAAQILALSEDPEVDQVSYDSPVQASLDVALRAVRADRIFDHFNGIDGTGIGIALIDTGVVSHVDLARPSGSPQTLEVEIVGHEPGLADYFGHGSLVAGVLGGNGLASSGPDAFRTFRGLAPGARLISIRALAPDGSGNTSDVITGIEWAIQRQRTYNIRVLNLSLGHPVYESYTTDPLCRAARAAVGAGIVVVVSAGNGGRIGSGFGTITSPGNEPSVVTVGAMDDSNTVTTGDDILAPYSSKGPTLIDNVVKPDLVAPGSRIVSLRATGSYLDTNYHDLTLQVGEYRTDPANAARDGDYFELSGTSLAAPMVSAAAALMLQREPGLTPATVKARLMKSAEKDNDWLILETGAGFLDVKKAMEESAVAQSALSPVAQVRPDGTLYVTDPRETWGLSWSEGAIWGGTRTLGTMATVENDQVTASGVVWGGGPSVCLQSSGSVAGQAVVWGGGGN